MSNTKTYVLDTSVMLYNADSIRSFGSKNVVLPYAVLEELDRFKTREGEVGRNARQVARELNKLRETGDLRHGVVVNDKGGKIRVELNHTEPLVDSLHTDKADDRILNVCLGLKKDEASGRVILVTKDINLAIRADVYGIEAQGFDADRLVSSASDIYTGSATLETDSDILDEYFSGSNLHIQDITDDERYFHPNLYINLVSDNNKSALTRVGKHGKLEKLRRPKQSWGVVPKNREQEFAFDALMNRDIPLVSLCGQAGTGKSLISLACALEQVQDQAIYDRLIVSRPIQPMGRDLGYLPGSVAEKMDPWMGPIKDAIAFLTKNRAKNNDVYTMMLDKGMLEIEPLTYIRGRSIPNTVFVIDECIDGEQTVLTKEGKIKLKTLYNRFDKGEVLPEVKSFDTDNQTFVWATPGKVWKRGLKKVLKVRSANRTVKCTPDHLFLTSSGWKKAQNLNPGDLLISTEPDKCQLLRSMSADQRQVFLGSFLGDGNAGLSFYKGNKPGRVRLKIQHGLDQEVYLRWKAELFGRSSSVEYIEKNGYAQKPAFRFSTLMLGVEKELPTNKSYCPQWILDDLDERGLAIWLMDDGSISSKLNAGVLNTQSFDEETHIRIVKMLRKKFGIDCTYIKCYRKEKNKSYFQVSIRSAGVDVLRSILTKYIHPSMSYKIRKSPGDCGSYVWGREYNSFGYSAVDEIVHLEEETEVYDLEVPGYGTFIISGTHTTAGSFSGVVVHNCQDLTRAEIKTIVSRMGDNSKLILIGDVMQISNPYLNPVSSGLSGVIERFKDYDLAAHITLTRGERSDLATLAASIL